MVPVDGGELVEATPMSKSSLRGVRATFRVAREIASDLIARKMAHAAGAGAVLVLLTMFFVLRNPIVQGAASTARQFRAGGMLDEAQLANVLGRGAAAGEYWSLLIGSIFLSALFAPPLLDTRRSTLLLAQPVSRADVANGIFASVLALAFAIFTACGLVLFVGLRLLGLPVATELLLVPVLTTVAFAALYASVLLATYLLPNGLLAAVVGVAMILALLVAGNLDAARPGEAHRLGGFFLALLPKLVGLHRETMRLGGGSGIGAYAILSTVAYTVALMLAVQIVARRSER